MANKLQEIIAKVLKNGNGKVVGRPVLPVFKGKIQLPPIERAIDLMENPPAIKPELIKGILRQGHKMMLNGPSKSGKSFCLINLALSLSNGIPWLDFECEKVKTLYINFEIEKGSFMQRLRTVSEALGSGVSDLNIWNLRGFNRPFEELIPELIGGMKGLKYGAVILDPLYKLYTSKNGRFDENGAASVASLFNELDRVITECDCSLIMAGHFSKGSQGWKAAIDRISGSGVLGRDPDAILTLSELENTDKGYRIEPILREFKSDWTRSVRWEYPLHIVDPLLDQEPVKGGPGSKRQFTPENLNSAFENSAKDAENSVSLEDLKKHMGGGCLNTVRGIINKMDEFGTNDYGLSVKGQRIHGKVTDQTSTS